MNLLADPLLRVRTVDGLRRLSLPELMGAMGRDEVVDLPGLQRHQEDAFHVLLSCLAAAVLERRRDPDAYDDDAVWQAGLRMLAGSAGDGAWTLAVADSTRPAFLQPPLSAEQGLQLRGLAATPDELDLLPTAKNHDVKQARATGAEPDTWVYALVSVQTMSGFYGRGNHGISRMNGGFGNRSIVELERDPRPGPRWRDAVSRLREHRRQLLAEPYGYRDDGLALVWTAPWKGDTGLPLAGLDPSYVEICRRIRLQEGPAGLRALSVPTGAPRIAAAELHGVVGDAWLPVDLRAVGTHGDGEKALTAQGLGADVLRQLIFAEGFRLSPLQRPGRGWHGDAWFCASVLVRGQGTTEGFHERRIRIPPPAQPRVFGPPERRDPLAALARTGVEYAGLMQNRVLKPAILAYLSAALSDEHGRDRDAAQAWLRRFTERFETLWSDRFFPWLWAAPETADPATPLTSWAKTLRDLALGVLGDVEQALPTHVGRRYRARVAAERRFHTALVRNFPLLKEGAGHDADTGA